MSLTNFINDSPVYKDFILQYIPRKSDFYTLSGKQPFSTVYDLLVPNNKLGSVNSSISGTAFDYLARYRIAQKVSYDYPLNIIENTVAKQGLDIILRKATKKQAIVFQTRYQSAIDDLLRFIRNELDVSVVVKHLIYFAKLEMTFRSGGLLPKDGLMSILTISDKIVDDLLKLFDVFEANFIQNIVSVHSRVIFNPTFGHYSNLIGGADADIIIDDTLYDFKTIIKSGYSWKHAAQLLSYYFMNILNLSIDDDSGILKSSSLNVSHLALYYARYGECCVYDTNNLKDYYNEILTWFVNFFDKLENEKDFFLKCFIKETQDIQSFDRIAFKHYRTSNKLTQNDMAKILGVSQKTVKCWELGYSSPSSQNIKRINSILYTT